MYLDREKRRIINRKKTGEGYILLYKICLGKVSKISGKLLHANAIMHILYMLGDNLAQEQFAKTHQICHKQEFGCIYYDHYDVWRGCS